MGKGGSSGNRTKKGPRQRKGHSGHESKKTVLSQKRWEFIQAIYLKKALRRTRSPEEAYELAKRSMQAHYKLR